MYKRQGLGLSVVFGTVKSHSGYLNVASSPGQGTRFEIFIPIHKKHCMPDKIKTTEERNNTVMLVDDEVSVLDIEAEMLEDVYKRQVS